MAQYQHLPIYRSTYQLLELVVRLTRGFPKDLKYSLGERIRAEVVELVVFIFKANSARQGRAEHVANILDRMQVIELLLRLSKDMRLLSVKQFSATVELTDGIGRQALGICRQANAFGLRREIATTLRDHGHLVSPLDNRMFAGDPL